ncbi:chitin synthase regulatory factor Chr3 [Schizosaccharomyces cryophilus OY26]|uniref:Chitin synthase regulatory factor Chr3 n=1 Tax=Schizosaccharomyces cryophilus (strain OY26 / ATCC MYA-4695 / CBS 11777 / NBRC 106824 / NRRL Y48691) TaxID=653667 RepID=S9W401_SCHCR|nr:chitin synthase regulatory factor Chr3 [Schizosaccharomyces cryophilus OY26]EPY52680.1 chitin synthase regulatory factor Chr3 [Schizosaccharomyces cryophilus OY26]
MHGSLNSRKEPKHEKLAESPRPGARAEGLPAQFRGRGNATTAGASLLFRPTSRYPTLSKDPTPTAGIDVSKRFDVTRGISPNDKAVKRTAIKPMEEEQSQKTNEDEPVALSQGKVRMPDPEAAANPRVKMDDNALSRSSEFPPNNRNPGKEKIETARQDMPIKIIRPTPRVVSPRFNPQIPNQEEKFMPPPRVNSISHPKRRISYIPYGGFDSFLDNYYDDDQTVSRNNILEENENLEGQSESDEDANLDVESYTPSNASSDAEPNVRSFTDSARSLGPSDEGLKAFDTSPNHLNLRSDFDYISSQNLNRKNRKSPFPQPRYPNSQTSLVPTSAESIGPIPINVSTEEQHVPQHNANFKAADRDDLRGESARLRKIPSSLQTDAPIPPVPIIRNIPPSPAPIARAESTPVGNSIMASRGSPNLSSRNGMNDIDSNLTGDVKGIEENIGGMSIDNSSSPAVLEMNTSEPDSDAIPCHPDDKLLIPPPKNVTHADLMTAEQSLRKSRGISPLDEVDLAKLYLDALETLENKPILAPDQATYNTRISVYRTRAIELLKKHAFPNKTQHSVAEAIFLIGQFYSQGVLGFQRDVQKAFELYSLSSKKGHPLGTYRTAVCLQTGIGVKPDARKSVLLYRKAAEMDIVEAMFRVGLIYLNGLLSQKVDVPLGIEYMERACETQRPEAVRAMYELAKIYERSKRFGISVSSERKFELYKLSASYGLPAAQCKLGECFEHGLLNCVPEPRRSIFWYTRAAEQDYGEAELGLSGWYLTGAEDILLKNNEEALLWAHKAAVKGLAKAQFAVGFMMEQGIGISADPAAAHSWYIRAAKQGFVKAQKRLEEQSLSTKKSQPKKNSKKRDEQCSIM